MRQEAIGSYMRREEQRCIAAALQAVELLGHNVAHSSDGYNSSSSANHHFISMLPVRTMEAQQDIEEETHTAVSAVRFKYILTQHTHHLGVRERQIGRYRDKSSRSWLLTKEKPI